MKKQKLLIVLVIVCLVLAAFTACGDKCKDGHDYGEWTITKAATCYQDGTKTRTCSVCGEVENGTDAKTGEHTYGEYVVTTPATCTVAGVETATCTTEGCTATKTRAIAATGEHTYGEYVVTTPATCCTDGVKTRTCSSCNGTDTAPITKTGEHTYGEYVVTTPATCTVAGEETRTCTTEGCTESQTRPISATGTHTYVNGVCSSCNASEGNHDYVDGVCSKCGGTAPTYTLVGTPTEAVSFGGSYTCPQYFIERNGADTGYKAKAISATDPDGANVTISYGSFAASKQGEYTIIYRSNGLAEEDRLEAEIEFTVKVTFADLAGPTIVVSEQSTAMVWVGKAADKPVFEASDASGIKENSAHIYVKLPDGSRVEVTTSTYVPAVAGEFAWVYEVLDTLDNKSEKTIEFTVYAVPDPTIENCIGYFDREFGLHQIALWGGGVPTAEVVADHAWSNGRTGAIKITQSVAQIDMPNHGHAVDGVAQIELVTPFIAEVTSNYDYIMIPVYNPSDVAISFRAWFFHTVIVEPGETVYYAVPSSHFAKGSQAMTDGNYNTIFDVTGMIFQISDRYNS